jgi:hypothetical protein
MANLTGMTDTSMASDQRQGDYRQKLRDYAVSKRRRKPSGSVFGVGFVYPGKRKGSVDIKPETENNFNV